MGRVLSLLHIIDQNDNTYCDSAEQNLRNICNAMKQKLVFNFHTCNPVSLAYFLTAQVAEIVLIGRRRGERRFGAET